LKGDLGRAGVTIHEWAVFAEGRSMKGIQRRHPDPDWRKGKKAIEATIL